MIFSPALAAKVLAGEKVMTRRRMTHRDGRPLLYRAGGVYAVQPGRGRPHVAHIKVWHVTTDPLAYITTKDARAEGFGSRSEFWNYWAELHGRADLNEVVAVIRFDRAPDCADCRRGRELAGLA